MRKYENVNISKLIPYENNARTHSPEQVAKIVRSIEEFGFINPVLIDGDFGIIAGHGRVIAAKQMGMTEVPCLFIEDLTEAQKKAYILADNKLAEDAGWDENLLKIELAELEAMDFDVSLTGFDLADFELEDYSSSVTEDDYDAEPPIEPKAKLGEIYQLGRHRLMCGDSTDRATIDKLLDGAKVDMVMTDPPYGIDVVGDNGEVGANFGVAKKGNYSKVIADNTTDTAKASYEILKELCDRLIIWGGNYFLDFLSTSDGWLIWDKRVDSGIRNTFADGEMAYCSFHTPIRIYHQLWNGMIREGEKEKRVHPTQKPIKMLSEILCDFTKENEIVLDVFGGSGSTLIACEQLNRTCYMMELDAKYVDVIIDRWEKLTGGKAVLLNA